MIKVGIGQDSHKFSKAKKPMVLGGFVIPGENGLEANSDGDVILHSLFNALSQSVGGKSLGYYADPMFRKGITDSREYIKVALDMVTKKGYGINNAGIMVEAMKPRLECYSDKIKESLCKILGLGQDNVGITFTSGEGLTEFGKGRGIQAISIISITRK